MKKIVSLFLSFLMTIFVAVNAQNVGISNSIFTPRSYLHVHQPNTSGNLLQLTNSTSGNANNTSGLVFSVNGASYTLKNHQVGFLSFETTGSDITFSDGTAERMRIQNGGRVGIGTTAPANCALLDIRSTTAGVLIPRVALTATNTYAPVTGASVDGLLVYNTATNGTVPNNVYPGFYYRSGTRWVRLMSSATSADGWLTTGNLGTTPANNWIGTNDAQDFVFKTGGTAAANERMRIDQYGSVGIGFTTMPYRFMVFDGLSAGQSTVGSIYSTAFFIADADNDADNEPLSAVFGSVENITSGRDNIVGVYGSVESALSFGAVGVAGSVGGGFYPSWAAGTAGFYSNGIFGTLGGSTDGVAGYYLNNVNANTDGGYFVNKNAFNSGTIWKTGVTASVTGDYGIKAGGYFSVDGRSASLYGLIVRVESAAGADPTGTLKGCAAQFINKRLSSGGSPTVGIMVGANDITPTFYLGNNGIGGSFVARDYGIYTRANVADGFGITAIGENRTDAYELVDGAGGAFSGIDVGSTSHAQSLSGTGVFGVGQSQIAMSSGTGQGGAFTGLTLGIYAYSISAGNDSWAGYFQNGNAGTVTRIGGTQGGLHYAILSAATKSTIVRDLDENPVIMYCTEAPEVLFQDYGYGKMENGRAVITLDPIFSKNIFVSEDKPLKVFIQLEGECNGVYVTNKTQYGFEVVELNSGNSNVPFTYTIVANRVNEYDDQGQVSSAYADVRFPKFEGELNTVKAHQTKNNVSVEAEIEQYDSEKNKAEMFVPIQPVKQPEMGKVIVK